MGKVLGLDIGIASVGWSLLDTDKNKIIDLGVRLFDSADASNNQQRRESRSARRNLRRKKYRLECIENLLAENGFFPPDNINLNPYELRVKGLREKLSKLELYAALYHLAKRRGISYLDEVEDDGKNISNSLNVNRELSKEMHPCEIQLQRLEDYGKVRGLIEIDEDGYKEVLINVFTTGAYAKEAQAILEQQQNYYSQIDDEFIEEYIKILTRKRPFYVGPGDELNRTNYGIYKTDGTTIDSIFEELIGKCTIYNDERRAPASSYTSQEFNILNDLNNLVVKGRKLTEEEKKNIIDKVLQSTTVRIMNIIKNITGIDNEGDIKGFRVDKKGKPEFHTFEAERKIAKFLRESNIRYHEFDVYKKDKLAEILSLSMDYKTLEKNCKKDFPEFSDDDISSLFTYLQKNRSLYSRWHSFSLRLMKELRDELYKSPKNQMSILIEKGIKKKIQGSFCKYKFIPIGFLDDEIYNPIVKRSVNQSVLIINAILKKYGDLEAIIIEMPRDTNAEDEKKKLSEIQKQNEEEKSAAIDRARNEYSISEEQLFRQRDLPSKIRLWYQQDGRCIYSGRTISIQELVNNPKTFQIDHIIPKSISLDDSINNKVLTYSNINQLKAQRTPFNAFAIGTTNGISYKEIKDRASNLFKNKKISKTKYDLLTFEEDISKYDVRQKFINRNLNDTRYASKVILNGLQEFMREKGKTTEIYVVRGKFTYQVRKRWGIEKDRDESFEHHGVDATIVAASYMIGQSEGTIRNPFLQRIGKYDKSLWKIIGDDDYDKEVYKLPWNGFIQDLNMKLNNIKYSHKIDTKVNRTISDATLYSTRKIENEDYIVEKYKNIYDNSTAKKVIDKIKTDMEIYKDASKSKILMRKHDPRTFEILLKIIEQYSGEKPNPFEAYRLEHGYIRKYSKKGNGPIIKDIKYLSTKLGEGIEVTNPNNLSNNRKIVLLSLKPFRTDVYFSAKLKSYKCIRLNYNDLIFKDKKYIMNIEDYNKLKKALEINETYEFLFSLHKNDIVGITRRDEPNSEERYRFLSSPKPKNHNIIEVKPINKNKFDPRKRLTIGRDVIKFNKYHTDVLGKVFNIKNEKLKLEFTVDNINQI